MTTWLVRLAFTAGNRQDGEQVAASHVEALGGLPGVERVEFHRDLNDESALWAIWRLATYDHLLNVYDEPVFKAFASALKPLLVPRTTQNIILAPVTP